MNPDKPTTAPVAESFKDNLKRAAELLEVNHQAEHAYMIEAGKALSQAGQHDTYNAELQKAWELHQAIEKTLASLTEEDEARSFTSFEEELLADVRQKTKAYGEIRNNISAVLEKLGYGEEEEGQSASAEEESTADSITPIERLSNLYKNADPSVFVESVNGDRRKMKGAEAISKEIESVLRYAGFDEDTIRVFINEVVKKIRNSIRENAHQQSEAESREQRQSLREEKDKLYQGLLDEVAQFMKVEKVAGREVSAEVEPSPESEEDIDTDIQLALQEFNLLKQDGAFTESNQAYAQAVKAAQRLVQHDEKDAAVAANNKKRYFRILKSALSKLKTYAEVITLDPSAVREVDDAVSTEEPVSTKESVGTAESEAGVTSAAASEEKNEKKYEEHFHSKKEFKAKNREYKEALKAYYEDKNNDATWRAKFRNGLDDAKKVFGINPELPPAIQAMKDESRRLRSVYVSSLAGALAERAGREGNRKFDIGSDKAKIAFGRKFILEPNQEMLKLQEDALPPETAGRVKKILQTFSKYKWHTRIGTVVLAGGLGLASGGVGALMAGASYQAWKMTASAGMGAGAGLLTKKAMQGRTEAARTDAALSEAGATEAFSVADLDILERKLEQAQLLVNTRERQEKVATIAAAVAAGGLTGYGLSQFDVNEVLPQDREGLSREAVGRIVNEELAAEVPVVEPGVPSTPAVPTVAEPTVEQTQAVVPEKIDGINIERFTIPFYGESGERLFETVISGIKIEGSFAAGELPEATQLELEKFIKLQMDDALHAHPWMTAEKLEPEVLAKVQAKFGAAPWYAEAGITKIDIIDMTREEYFLGAGAPPLEINEQPIAGGNRIEVSIGSNDSVYTEGISTNSSETATSAESGPNTYVVQKGDTLFEIAQNKFAEQLKEVPEAKRAVVLDQLFKNIEANADLRGSLGMRSNDIDLIYPNETLNLAGVEAELSRLIDREQVTESFRPTGPLSVEGDAPVKEVPITVVEKPVPVPPPVPAAVEVPTDTGRVYTEAVPPVAEKPEVLTAPRPNALNGQYAEHPDYKAFIDNSFESRKEFERIVEKSATNFDNATYDVFERSSFFGGANYESPYRFMGEKSLEGLSEFQSQPNEEIRAFLKENKMKYETYLAWVDLIDEMKTALPNQPSTTVADLFQRYVAETLVPGANPLIKKS